MGGWVDGWMGGWVDGSYCCVTDLIGGAVVLDEGDVVVEVDGGNVFELGD